MSKNNKASEPVRDIQEDIRDIRNDIERIKSDTHNLNRITTVANTTTIINDLKNIIGSSLVRVAMIHLTKDEISAQDLAQQLGISHHNVPKYIDPLTNKAYISELKKNGRRYYKRVETIDLINFESISEFSAMIEEWKKKREEKNYQSNSPQNASESKVE